MNKNNPVLNCNVVQVCQDLVRIQSVNPPGGEKEIAAYCGKFLETLDFEVQYIHHSDTRTSALARLRGTGEKPGLLICSHIDTVPIGSEPWQHDPFSGDVIDGKLYGRGASDMKGGLSAALAAAKAVKDNEVRLKGDLWLAMTAGEEVDFLGARELSLLKDEILPLQAILLPEPSSNRIYIAQKGALWLEVTFLGKTAHGSMPQYGINALNFAVEFLNRLSQMEIAYTEHPLLGGFTLAPTTIRGGVKTNVIPDACSVTIDMRTVPGQSNDQILNQVCQLADQITESNPGLKSEVRVLNNANAVTTPDNHQILHMFSKAVNRATGRQPVIGGVNYFTDAAILTPAWDVPMLICGPGKDEMAHQPDEYVDVSRLKECERIYSEAILEFLG